MIAIVTWVLNIIFFGLALFALVDVIRRPAQAFPAVDRQTKVAWLIFLGLSTVILFIFGVFGRSFLGIVGVIVTMFYFVDVRPKVREVSGRQ